MAKPACTAAIPVQGAAALAVLADAHLFRAVVSWSGGWPALVVLRWREIKAARNQSEELTPRDFMWELIWRRDLRALELTKRVHDERFVLDNIRLAIEAGDAEAVRLAHAYSSPADGARRRLYWALAIRDFPEHFKVLEELYALECPDEIDLQTAIPRYDRGYFFPIGWELAVARIDSAALAEWLVDKFGPIFLPSSLLRTAIRNGNLALVRFLNSLPGQEIRQDLLREAYRQKDEGAGFSAVFDFLLYECKHFDTRELEQVCFDAGDHETLTCCAQARGLLYLDDVNIDKAASRGHLEVIQLVMTHTRATCTTDAMDGAARNGHLRVVQFLHEHRLEGCTTQAMDRAAAGGFLDVVKFLHDHRQEGCTTQAMDLAARNGHLHVVQFLHENRHEGCTVAALSYPRVARRRTEQQHFRDVRSTLLFMLEHRKEMHSETLEREALRSRDLDVLTIIQRTRGLQFLRNVDIDAIAGEGNLPLIQFLVAHTSVVCSTLAMDAAAVHNHLEVVTYLHETRTEGCTSLVMDLAANANSWDVVAFLDENRHEGCSGVLQVAAVRLGRLDLVQRYVSRVAPEQCGGALVVAGIYGHIEIQAFLSNWIDAAL